MPRASISRKVRLTCTLVSPSASPRSACVSGSSIVSTTPPAVTRSRARMSRSSVASRRIASVRPIDVSRSDSATLSAAITAKSSAPSRPPAPNSRPSAVFGTSATMQSLTAVSVCAARDQAIDDVPIRSPG